MEGLRESRQAVVQPSSGHEKRGEAYPDVLHHASRGWELDCRGVTDIVTDEEYSNRFPTCWRAKEVRIAVVGGALRERDSVVLLGQPDGTPKNLSLKYLIADLLLVPSRVTAAELNGEQSSRRAKS